MIAKPVHRRRSLVSGDDRKTSPGSFWLLPGLLLIQALFIGSAFTTLAAVLAATGFAFLIVLFFQQWGSVRDSVAIDGSTGWFRKLALPFTLLVVVTIGGVQRTTEHLAGSLNPVAMIVDSVAHLSFFISLTLWVFYPRCGHPAMLGCGLLLVLTTVTGGGVSQMFSGQLVAALATVAGFVIAANHILSNWSDEKAKQIRKRSRNKHQPLNRLPLPGSTVSIADHRGRAPMLFSVLAISVLLMSTTAAGHVASIVVPGLQLDFFDRLTQSLESVTSQSIIGGTRYVRGSRLGSVRQHMMGDPGDPALRAVAETAPGYLRGTVFDSYQSGVWSTITERNLKSELEADAIRPRSAAIEMPGQTLIVGPSRSRLDRFQVRKNLGGHSVGTIEVHNVPMKGQLVFTSLSTEWMEAATYGVTLSHHDAVIKGVDTREPYILGISSEAPRETLEPIRSEILLALSSGLRDSVTPIAQSICKGRLTPRAKARAIESYFQSNFVYSLSGVRTPDKADPVVYFLEKRHPGHCEFFATAAAVMLRAEGVPTRYVTGYVVGERSEDGKYWMARNRDAHAWVEAYDRISEQWFPVEATVGRTYQSLAIQAASSDSSTSSQTGFLDLEDDESLLGMIFGRLLAVRTSDSLTFLFQIAQLPLFCIVIALLWIRNRQKVRAANDPAELASRQMLHKVDRRVKKFALVRHRTETLHQFAQRVESSADVPRDAKAFLMQAAQWYRSFAAARYQGKMPLPMESA